jgi:hypothetical protein
MEDSVFSAVYEGKTADMEREKLRIALAEIAAAIPQAPTWSKYTHADALGLRLVCANEFLEEAFRVSTERLQGGSIAPASAARWESVSSFAIVIAKIASSLPEPTVAEKIKAALDLFDRSDMWANSIFAVNNYVSRAPRFITYAQALEKMNAIMHGGVKPRTFQKWIRQALQIEFGHCMPIHMLKNRKARDRFTSEEYKARRNAGAKSPFGSDGEFEVQLIDLACRLRREHGGRGKHGNGSPLLEGKRD